MLRVFGNMHLAQVAGTKDEIENLKVHAKTHGSDLLVEDGNFLYARAIFMGYDLPNGNGDAIPSIYAGTFGPSFIGKHVDVNHQLDPDSLIGRIMGTWHVQKPLIAGDGPKVIGRNVLGRDIDGRPKVFGFAPPVEAEPMELQLEGIFRIDRSSHAGDIMARKLIAKEIDSVSQEASTAYCLCPVCAHKISMPWDIPCEHLTYGSLMLKAYKVKGYEHDILAYKVHHEPSGTGLGCVGVPAYDKAKIPELVASLRNGHMSVQAFQQLLREQEMVWGKNMFVIQASKELDLLAAELNKKTAPAPLTPGTPKTSGTPTVPLTPGTKLQSGLQEAINALAPVENDDRNTLYAKLVSVAKAQGRLNRESMSLTRHVAVAAASAEAEAEGSLDLLAERVCVVAETQSLLDLTRRTLMAGLGIEQQKPNAADGQLLAADALASIKTLAMGLRAGATRFSLKAAKNQIDVFMPSIKSLQAALYADGKGLAGAAEAGALYVEAEKSHGEFTKRFDAWRDAGFPAETDAKSGDVAKAVSASFMIFKAAFEKFEASQTKLLPANTEAAAQAVDITFGLEGSSAAPRRLRMRAGTMDLVAAFRGQKTDERSRAVVAAYHASTAEWVSPDEIKGIMAKPEFKNSIEASEAVNGLGLVLSYMNRSTFRGGFKAAAMSRFAQARQEMTKLVTAEKLQAAKRVLSRTWLKAFSINPSFDVKASAKNVLAESKTGLAEAEAVAIGVEVQAAGGPWPWTAEKPVSWKEFVASKTNDELVAVMNDWKGRGSDDLAKAVVMQNVSKLEALLKDRQAAVGVTAKFFRKPVLAESTWTVFNASGNAVGRFTLAAAAQGKLERFVVIGGKKVFLATWLQTQQYGRDIVAHAKTFGLEATLSFFIDAKKVNAGGGAGISFEDFEIADGGEGVVQADGSIKWNRFPTLASFSAHGYMDGMSKVRGSLIEIVGVDSNLKGDVKPGDKVSLRKIDFKPVWQGGWIRSTPKAGDIIHLETQYSDVVYMVEAVEEHDSFEVEASGALDVRVTPDFVDFYNDVFEYPTIEDEDVKEFAEANKIPLPENQEEFDALRQKLVEYHYEDAQTNWSASLRRRVRANKFEITDHEKKSESSGVVEVTTDNGVHLINYIIYDDGRMALDRDMGEDVYLAIANKLGIKAWKAERKPHYHGDMSHAHENDPEGHSHGDPENVKWKSDIPSSRYKRVEDNPKRRPSAANISSEKLFPGDYGTERGSMPLGKKPMLEGLVIYRGYTIEKSGDNFYVKDPKGHRAFSEVPATVEIAKKWIDMERAKKKGDVKGGRVYQPMTGAEHGAFVAFVSAVADALEQDTEFEEIVGNFPMSMGAELTETIPSEFAAANVDIKEFVDKLVPDAQEVIDAYDKAFAGKTTMQELADEFGDKVWSSAVLSAMGHGVGITDDPNVSSKLKELGFNRDSFPRVYKDNLGYDEAWSALTKYASQGD